MKRRDRKLLVKLQKRKLAVYAVYSQLSKKIKDKETIKEIKPIARQKLKDYHTLKSITSQKVKPNDLLISYYLLISKLFGIAFSLKLMERNESKYVRYVFKVSNSKPVGSMKEYGKEYEKLLGKISDSRIKYAGAIVLGLNDALVELTGALAGLTFALQNTRLVAVTGLITGFAASLSMAASGYLSFKEYDRGKGTDINPLTSAVYTGVAYILTVLLLVLPYFILNRPFAALSLTLTLALLVVFGYTYYISVAKNTKFWPRFGEMALISLIVALISFGVGWVLKSTVRI